MAVRSSHVLGSLKDMIYRVPLEQRFSQKRSLGLRASGLPLSPAGVARYGRHILEGLCYFKFFGFPYPYLHAGNVLITGGGASCVLTDFENAVPGTPPAYAAQLATAQDASQWEVMSFGLLLFEMATGRPPALPSGSLVSEAPEYVQHTLRLIFPDGVVGGCGKCIAPPATTLEKLALGELFGKVSSPALDAIQKKDAVFAGPIEKSVATYFRKLRPALARLVDACARGNAPVAAQAVDIENRKKVVAAAQKKRFHKSSGKPHEAPKPSSLSDVISGNNSAQKIKQQVEKEEDGDDDDEDDDDTKVEKSNVVVVGLGSDEEEESDVDKSSSDESENESGEIDEEKKDKKKSEKEKKKKKSKKDDKDNDEAQKFIEAYGGEEDKDDDSFDIFNEYEEPANEEEQGLGQAKGDKKVRRVII